MTKSKPFSKIEQENYERGIAYIIEENAIVALRAKDHSSEFYDSEDVDKEQRDAEHDVKKKAKIAAKIIKEIILHYQMKGINISEEELTNNLLPHCWKESKRIYNEEIQLQDTVKRYINDRDKR